MLSLSEGKSVLLFILNVFDVFDVVGVVIFVAVDVSGAVIFSKILRFCGGGSTGIRLGSLGWSLEVRWRIDSSMRNTLNFVRWHIDFRVGI